MKISKIAIAVLFAAGFLTTSATASMATSCVEGYKAVEGVFPDPMYTCELIEAAEGNAVEPVAGEVDVKPIDSCWTTEDGTDVCARGGGVPMTTTTTPVDLGECDPSGLVDAEGNQPEACYYDVPDVGTGEEGEGVIVDEGTVDETLMYQSGVVKTATTPDATASNTLAAFGVLVGALGALGIGLSRQREAKK